MTPRTPEAGVTLIEMMVALAIFALIGTAGFSMLDQVLRTESRTDGRLETLGDMQRALYLLGLDASMAEGRSLRASPEAVGFARGGGATLRYAVAEGVLRRRVLDGQGRRLADQPLIRGCRRCAGAISTGSNGWNAGRRRRLCRASACRQIRERSRLC